MSPIADDGAALIITFPRVWTAEQRLAFTGRRRARPASKRWAHVGERMCTDSIEPREHRRALTAPTPAARCAG